jgi:amicyanin
MGMIATCRTLAAASGLGLAFGAVLALSVVRAEGTAKEVTIDNFTFAPAELSVPVGTTVTWINRDDIPHTVVAKDKGFRSKALDTDDRYSFTFASAGTYDYFCGLHPHMTGKIVVTP